MASPVLIPWRVQVVSVEALHVVLLLVLPWQLDISAIIVVRGEVHLEIETIEIAIGPLESHHWKRDETLILYVFTNSLFPFFL